MADATALQYTAEHEWVLVDGDTATVGITAYAADKLGDVVYVDLPAVGSTVASGAIVGEIVGGEAGAGAAAGAVAARGQSRRQNIAVDQQAKQQQQAVLQQQQTAFARARATCLEGRGYTVK